MGGGDDRHQRNHDQNRPWAQTKMSERHRRQYSGKAGRVAAGATPGQGGGVAGVSGPLAWGGVIDACSTCKPARHGDE
ncbi:hypothetical protein EYR27_04240 [Xanthomonas oryzae]|nr:hypothetical protein EYR27_04240 [Xanthomonas oryzae]